MKVLFVMESSAPLDFGCAQRNSVLMENLSGAGVTVAGVTSPFMEGTIASGTEVINGVTYHRNGHLNNVKGVRIPALRWVKRIGMFSRYCRTVEEVCRQMKPDVIHAVSSYINGNAATRVGEKLNIPTLYEIRSLAGSTASANEGRPYTDMRYQAVWRLDKQAMLKATRLAPLSHALLEELVRRGIPRQKMDVVHNAIDPGPFTPRKRSEEISRRYGLDGCTVIGFIGSVRKIEGLSLLLEAAQGILSRQRDVKVLIVGGGEYLPILQKEAASRGIADRVVFTGRVPHAVVLDYYSVIDIFAVPRIDAIVNQTVAPLKPIEAMAAQKPIVASDVGGLVELIDDSRTGLIFKAGDATDLEAKLTLLLEDDQKRSQMGRAAREWVIGNRQWRNMTERYIGIYQAMLG